MKSWNEATKANTAIIRAMLNDEEFMCGGVFSKEEYYMKKYGLTREQMIEMQTHVWWAVTTGCKGY